MPSTKTDFELAAYTGFALGELSGFRIYLNAAVIGFIICFFTGNYSLIPFVVPLFVQVISRANVKYRQRHLSALVELPARTDAPVFIMDPLGNILLSVGKTLDLFRHHGIENITAILDDQALEAILETAATQTPPGTPAPSTEAFSKTTGKWYEIQAAPMGRGETSILVWFQDISLRKDYDGRLRDLLRYSGSLIVSLEDLVSPGAEFEHLSSFLLTDYEAVFITRTDAAMNLVGYVFKGGADGIRRSESILIPNESDAPINISRKKAQIISDDVDAYLSSDDFLKTDPFDSRVLEFIGSPVRNFITYNEADLSIIAFNFRSRITPYEERFFEILVNNFRTMVMLVDLEKKRTTAPDLNRPDVG